MSDIKIIESGRTKRKRLENEQIAKQEAINELRLLNEMNRRKTIMWLQNIVIAFMLFIIVFLLTLPYSKTNTTIYNTHPTGNLELLPTVSNIATVDYIKLIPVTERLQLITTTPFTLTVTPQKPKVIRLNNNAPIPTPTVLK